MIRVSGARPLVLTYWFHFGALAHSPRDSPATSSWLSLQWWYVWKVSCRIPTTKGDMYEKFHLTLEVCATPHEQKLADQLVHCIQKRAGKSKRTKQSTGHREKKLQPTSRNWSKGSRAKAYFQYVTRRFARDSRDSKGSFLRGSRKEKKKKIKDHAPRPSQFPTPLPTSISLPSV